MRPQRYLFSTFFRWIWLFAVLFVLATGLAHLPLGWHSSGLFSIPVLRPLLYKPTLWHYWANALLLLLLAYGLVIWIVEGRQRYRLTFFGCSRLILLFLLCLSGMLLALHNLAPFSLYGVVYPIFKLLHLAAALCFLPLCLVRFVWRGKWLRRRTACDDRHSRAGGMQIMPRQGEKKSGPTAVPGVHDCR